MLYNLIFVLICCYKLKLKEIINMLIYLIYNKIFLDKNNFFIIFFFFNILICVFKVLSFVNNFLFYI